MRPLIVMECMGVFYAISTTHGAAAVSSSGPSTLDEGTVIDCSRPNILISTACDGESSNVHMDRMGSTRKHLPNPKDPPSFPRNPRNGLKRSFHQVVTPCVPTSFQESGPILLA